MWRASPRLLVMSRVQSSRKSGAAFACCCHQQQDCRDRVLRPISFWRLLNGFVTQRPNLRVRIKQLPRPGELDEYDLHHLREGEVFEVTAQLGMLLVIGGYAELAPAFPISEAADGAYRPKRRQP